MQRTAGAAIGLLVWALMTVSPAAGPLGEDVRARLRIPAEAEPVFVDAGPVQEGRAITRVEAAHAGGDRLLFRLQYRDPVTPANVGFLLYLDLDDDPDTGRPAASHRGVDLMIHLAEGAVFGIPGIPVEGTVGMRHVSHNPAIWPQRENTFSVATIDGNDLYLTLHTPLLAETGATVPIRLYIGGVTAPTRVELPRSGAVLPAIGPPARTYRQQIRHDHHIDRHPAAEGFVALESFDYKGLEYWDVRPLFPVEYGRPTPPLPLAFEGRTPQAAGRAGRERVRVDLVEEMGVDRPYARIHFGLPLPAGDLFDLATLRLVDGEDTGIPAQFTAVSFWPDDSLKWVQVDAGLALPAGADRALFVEYGREVVPVPVPTALRIEEEEDAVMIDTGPMRVEIDRQRFNLLRRVWRAADGDWIPVARSGDAGIELVDAEGSVFQSSALPPERFEIEKAGPLEAVLRVEGPLARDNGSTCMRYVVRLGFRAGSARIEVTHTLVNDRLDTEFSDLISLVLPIEFEDVAEEARLYVADEDGRLEAAPEGTRRLWQQDDRVFRTDADTPREGRLPGLFSRTSPTGRFTVAVHEFWERWPKGLAHGGETLAIELLPRLPGPEFGADLPWYLQMPFVEGRYRLKWGMAFTDRLTLDFGSDEPEALLAEARLPLVPVLPGSWYAKTGALGRMAAPFGRQFAAYDTYVDRSFRAHLALKEEQREYGFMNYGDWFGERFNRNWGNNEYDLAHGFFMQFARTGNRDYYRFALAAARHQADVDTVHAYPDPFFIGANLQHSIGHAGVAYYHTKYKTWSWPYDQAVWGGNGHIWAHGMVAGWFLSGDARVKEAALTLGEHLVWSVPRLQQLTALGRTVGRPLRALHALYESTYDPAYLEAGRRLFRTIRNEERDERRLQGAIREGLMFLHEMEADPEVEALYLEGARLSLDGWNDEVEGFGATMNTWPRPMTAYAGVLSGDAAFMEITERIFANGVRGAHAIGKDIAMVMYMASDTMALLQDWYAQHRDDRGADVLATRDYGLQGSLLRAPKAERYVVRGPSLRRFLVRIPQGQASVTLTGTPHGPQRGERTLAGRVRWLDADTGEVLAEHALEAYGEHTLTRDLEGPDRRYRVEIEDDTRTVWDAEGAGAQVMVEVRHGFLMGTRAQRNRYFVQVPEGTESFSIRVRGAHDGSFGAAVLTPDGDVAGYAMGANTRGFSVDGDGWQTVEVACPPDSRGQVWELVLWASGNTAVEMAGIPPWMFLRRADGFTP